MQSSTTARVVSVVGTHIRAQTTKQMIVNSAVLMARSFTRARKMERAVSLSQSRSSINIAAWHNSICENTPGTMLESAE